MGVYRERIERALQSLLSNGFTMVSLLEAESFGDTEIVLVSESIKLRFLSERGQTLIEVALPSSPKGWYDLSRILAALGVRASPGPWSTPDEGVLAFRNNQVTIEQFLSDGACVSEIPARP